MNDDLPATLESMEKASLEFEELGQSLNILTGGFVKRNKASLQKRSGHQQTAKETKMETYSTAAEAETIKAASLSHDWSVVDALQAGTLASIRKIATDVSSLTAVGPFPLCRLTCLEHSLRLMSSLNLSMSLPIKRHCCYLAFMPANYGILECCAK